MKKGLKVISIVLVIVIILGLIFFIVDYNKIKNNEKPVFCINTSSYEDGGTVEYFGLGYKVIDFHTIDGFDDIKIGTWCMDYNDFDEEMKLYEKRLEEQLESENNINNKVTTIDIETALENPKKVYTLNQEEIYQIFNIIDNANFTKETCDGLPTYYIKYNSEKEEGFIIYGIEVYDNEYHITSKDKGEAILSDNQKSQLEEIIKNKLINILSEGNIL